MGLQGGPDGLRVQEKQSSQDEKLSGIRDVVCSVSRNLWPAKEALDRGDGSSGGVYWCIHVDGDLKKGRGDSGCWLQGSVLRMSFKLGVVVHSCNSSFLGGGTRKISV
jgi:hypothetical protein